MNVQIIQLATIRIVMLRHRGPYEELSAEFDRLFEWIERHGVPVARTIGIYYDNPDHVPANKLRSAACAEVPADYVIGDRDGLPIDIGQVAGGAYATTRYVGPYERMAPVWSNLTNTAEGALSRRIPDDVPAFEVYPNDPSEVPPHQLITDLYLPVL